MHGVEEAEALRILVSSGAYVCLRKNLTDVKVRAPVVDAAGVAVVTVRMGRKLRRPRHLFAGFVETELETVSGSV